MSWWPFRQLHAQGVHPLWATALCYLLVSSVLALWRPSALRDVLRTPALWVLMFASGCTNAAFNWGVTTGDVVRVVLLFYLMPLWTLLLARLLLREPLHARCAGARRARARRRAGGVVARRGRLAGAAASRPIGWA